jgi:predicted nucleic acid-binding protein
VILVDSSVWMDHFRKPVGRLAALLDAEECCTHPFVIGEIACGNLKNRKEIIALLHSLPSVHKAADDEILFFIERNGLNGRGVGLIDIHLLASCLTERCNLWTADKRLQAVAAELRIQSSQQGQRSA